MKGSDKLTILTGTAHPALARAIARKLNVQVGNMTVGRFPDGEIDVKIQDDIRGTDVFVIQPTCPPVNENIVELLLILDCVRRASADRITVVIPYYGYARKDRKDEGRVPISAKLFANLITGAGSHRVLAVDLHASQIQGFFDIPLDHLYAKPVLLGYFAKQGLKNPAVVAPDMGGMKRARAYASTLGARLAIVDKRRVSGEEVEWEAMVGEVEGSDCLLVDDMIATGGSIIQAAGIVKKFGAKRVFVAATHGVFCGSAIQKLEASAEIERVVVTDTIPQDGKTSNKIEVLSVATLLAEAIGRIHRSESVSALFEDDK